MKTKISIGLVMALAILSGCGTRQKETVPEKPTAEKIAPGKGALDSKLANLTNQITNSLTEAKRSGSDFNRLLPKSLFPFDF
ncbi:MAG: hypothetical protein JRF50_09665 [Deltaproteobacteria bacterium]|nr:hypothetical protein [Deltaproteobacteria bacterium]